MTVAHVDTSAAIKLVIEEAEPAALVTALTESSRRLAASWLLQTDSYPTGAGPVPSGIGPASHRQTGVLRPLRSGVARRVPT